MKRGRELEGEIADDVMVQVYDPRGIGVNFPYPEKDWELEDVPEGEDQDGWPPIWVHKPTGQRFEIDVSVLVTSLADAETEKVMTARMVARIASQVSDGPQE